jgi:hypothetical protein
MAESIICSMSVFLKLKPMNESTHIKKNKSEMAKGDKDDHMHINRSLLRNNR